MRFRICKADPGAGRSASSAIVANDVAGIRHGLPARHIVALLAMRRTTHGSGLGLAVGSSSGRSHD